MGNGNPRADSSHVGAALHFVPERRAFSTVEIRLTIFRFTPWALASALLLTPAARAQMAPSPIQSAMPSDALAPVLAQMSRDFSHGFYDDIISHTDELIGDEAAKPADPRLLYWRGLTYYQLAWYPEATADLKRALAGGVQAQPGGFASASALDKIERITPFVPPQERAVESGGQTVFRVHYVSENAGTRAAIDCLGPAYRSSAKLFDADVVATSVYIFDTYDQFAACYNARVGKAPENWVAAVTINGVLYIPLRNRQGQSTPATDPDFFRSMVAHEFNHAMLRRLMGTAELPKWFSEGLADFAGGQVVSDDVAVNDAEIKRLFAANALVAPTQLEYPDTFGSHTTLGAKLSEVGNGMSAPSPYQQSYNMMRYLLSGMKRDDLPKFLNLVRDNNSFSKAFARQFGASVPDFYASWYNDTGRKAR